MNQNELDQFQIKKTAFAFECKNKRERCVFLMLMMILTNIFGSSFNILVQQQQR